MYINNTTSVSHVHHGLSAYIERACLRLQPVPLWSGGGARLRAKALIGDVEGDAAGAHLTVTLLSLVCFEMLCLLFLFLFSRLGSRMLIEIYILLHY